MNQLLVPTDFSPAAQKALEYAKMIAVRTNGRITVLHVLNVPSIGVHAESLATDNDLVLHAYREAEKRLNDTVHQLKEQGFAATAMLIEGTITDAVAEAEKNVRPSLIVMGTTGATGFLEKFIGTNAATVMAHTKSPILMIPESTEVRPFMKILLATELEGIDTDTLDQVFTLARNFEGYVDLIKVNTQYQLDIFADNLQLDEIKKTFPHEKYHVIFRDADSAEKGIDEYMQEHNTDLLVMSSRKRNVLEKLFNPSLTRKMALHTKVPFLVYHEEE